MGRCHDSRQSRKLPVPGNPHLLNCIYTLRLRACVTKATCHWGENMIKTRDLPRTLATLWSLEMAVTGCSGGEPSRDGLIGANFNALSVVKITRGIDQQRDVSDTGRTTISLQGPASTVCRLYPASATDSIDSLEIVTNGEGLAQLDFEPVSKEHAPDELTMDCVTGKDMITRSSIALSLTQHAGAVLNNGVRQTISGSERPALTGDPTLVPQAYLVSHGYPLRPDVSSKHFARWLEDVTKSKTIIDPALVEQPARHNAVNSGSWCGYVVSAQSGMFDVFGSWTVPSVTTVGGTTHADYSSLWVGLDGGFISSDIIQAGTMQNVAYFQGFGRFFSYSAWIEFFPAAWLTIANGPVSPGDTIDAETWPCDANFNIDFSAPYGCFYLSNATKNWAFQNMVAKPSGAIFVGDSAEWIIETPTVNNKLTNLANFATAQMTFAEADDFFSGWMGFGAEPNIKQDFLVDNFTNNVRLATPTAQGNYNINYTWNSRGTRVALP